MRFLLQGEQKGWGSRVSNTIIFRGSNRGREANKGDQERAASEIKGKTNKFGIMKARQIAYL